MRGIATALRRIPGGRVFVLAAAGCLALLVVGAVLAPVLAPADPQAIDLDGTLEGPSRAHPLGQDRLGRDVLAGILYGGRVSLAVGFSVVGVSLVVGTGLGLWAGYRGGWVDEVLMRVVDILLAFPGILLAIALAGVLGPSLRNLIIALCAMGWVGFARLVRGEVLSLREREFVTAARVLGAGPVRIALGHLLPNLVGVLAVQATFGLAGTILAESTLSFLGLGPQDVPTWGGLLSQGVDYLLFAPHLALFPGLAILVAVLGINVLGDVLRDRLDPRAGPSGERP
ncbi:ABC transporter permease [Deferrisoma camini]|uniref:ABC transporter permease n=1 Tax=Deferrisoma camini TaxID=1035120 RepID=UPI0004B2E32A|nr:ABC transporter permease [Deferrisoma camini]